VLRCAPHGAATYPTFCPSDLPVKISFSPAEAGTWRSAAKHTGLYSLKTRGDEGVAEPLA